ncbi:MAG: hypothetical protein U0869_01085 [Chloroflexota bacterium]
MLLLDTERAVAAVTGSLRDLEDLDDADVLTVPRYNAVIGPDELLSRPPTPDRLGDAWLFALGVLRPYEAIGPPGHPLDPGRHRAEGDGAWRHRRPDRPGDHNVRTTLGVCANCEQARDVLALHQPFSTLERFEREVDNIRATIRRVCWWFADNQGWRRSM